MNEDLELAARDEMERACTLGWRELARHLPWGDTFEGFTPAGREVAFERTYLWEPLLRLMKKYHAKPGQYGSFQGAIKFLHLALGIDPPEGAVKKMLHDLRHHERPKRRKGYAAVKRRPNA